MALSTFNVSDVIQKLADAEKINVSISGIDDTCYGLVISADKSFADFLNQHRGPYNFIVIDGDPIRIVRRAIGGSLTIDFNIDQTECIGSPAVQFNRVNPEDLPGQTDIAYLDVDRMFNITTQTAKHRHGKKFALKATNAVAHFAETTNARSRLIQSASIDFIISADQARQLAFDLLYRTWSQATACAFEHPNLAVEPGDTVQLTTDSGIFTLLVQESTITKNGTNQLKAAVLLASSGITIAAGTADNYSQYQTVGRASGVGMAEAVSSVALGFAGTAAGTGIATGVSAVSAAAAGTSSGTGNAVGAGTSVFASVGVASGSGTASAFDVDLNSGITAYWKFDENTGTTAADATGNGHTGTLAGTAAWATGKINSCIAFNTVNTGTAKVTFASLPTVGNGQAWSLAAWVYTTSTAGFQNILSDSSGIKGVYLNSSKIMFYDGAAGHSSTSTLTTGAWHHICMTWDATGNLHFYIDGADAGTGTVSSSLAFSPNQMGQDSGEGFIGSIDDAGFWGRALTAGEVSSLYNGGSGAQYPF